MHKLSPAEIRELFVNYDPVEVWDKAFQIVLSINPKINLTPVRDVFDDVTSLFVGSFADYGPVQTPYHDLRHTLDVFICAVRLLHGVHLSDTQLNDEEISLIMIAALLHDVGYAQKIGDEEEGSGAQFTLTHVTRGIAFMEQHLDKWHLPPTWKNPLAKIMRCTDPGHPLLNIDFPDPRTRLLGQIVGSADLVGQMADRAYLEKLLFLFLEFQEAHLGNYQNVQDLLKKTRSFYNIVREKFDGELGGLYQRLSYHFKDHAGEDRNFCFVSRIGG